MESDRKRWGLRKRAGKLLWEVRIGRNFAPLRGEERFGMFPGGNSIWAEPWPWRMEENSFQAKRKLGEQKHNRGRKVRTLVGNRLLIVLDYQEHCSSYPYGGSGVWNPTEFILLLQSSIAGGAIFQMIQHLWMFSFLNVIIYVHRSSHVNWHQF